MHFSFETDFMKYSREIQGKCHLEIIDGKSLKKISKEYRVKKATLSVWKSELLNKIANADSVTLEMVKNAINYRTMEIKILKQRLLIIEEILKLKDKHPNHN